MKATFLGGPQDGTTIDVIPSDRLRLILGEGEPTGSPDELIARGYIQVTMPMELRENGWVIFWNEQVPDE